MSSQREPDESGDGLSWKSTVSAMKMNVMRLMLIWELPLLLLAM
jgi:hypothetical protein